ncbi:MAG: hypothetical protein IJR01_03960 [Bacteroidales bacterium]|nr:hypothetical protein [Bacteroidales bacterium]
MLHTFFIPTTLRSRGAIQNNVMPRVIDPARIIKAFLTQNGYKPEDPETSNGIVLAASALLNELEEIEDMEREGYSWSQDYSSKSKLEIIVDVVNQVRYDIGFDNDAPELIKRDIISKCEYLESNNISYHFIK